MLTKLQFEDVLHKNEYKVLLKYFKSYGQIINKALEYSVVLDRRQKLEIMRLYFEMQSKL